MKRDLVTATLVSPRVIENLHEIGAAEGAPLIADLRPLENIADLKQFRPKQNWQVHHGLSARRRTFAKAIALGMSKRDAQIAAGYKPNRKHAILLLADPRVIAEIKRQCIARKHSKSVDLFAAELAEHER